MTWHHGIIAVRQTDGKQSSCQLTVKKVNFDERSPSVDEESNRKQLQEQTTKKTQRTMRVRHITLSNGLTSVLLIFMHIIFSFRSRGTTAFTLSTRRDNENVLTAHLSDKSKPRLTFTRRINSSTSLYWGFFRRNQSDEDNTETSKSLPSTDEVNRSTSTNSKQSVTVTIEPPPSNTIQKALTPEEEALRLRSEAAKSRLEAERMDAELTLKKIDKLERALKKQQMEMAMQANSTTTTLSSTTTSSSGSKKSTEEIQREIDMLLRKVKGETTESLSTVPSTSNTSSSTASNIATTTTAPIAEMLWPQFVVPFDENEYQNLYDSLNGIPQFLLGTMALQVEMEMDVDPITKKTKAIDTKKLADRLDQLRRQDFSYSKKKPPSFTQQQLTDLQREIDSFIESNHSTTSGSKKSESNWWNNIGGSDTDMFFSSKTEINLMLETLKSNARYQTLWDNKDTKSIAQLILEYQYFMELSTDTEKETEKLMQLVGEEEWLKPFMGGTSNITGTNAVIESLYPKCTTKKDISYDSNKPSPIPTEAAVKKLVSDVLPKAKFQVSSKPEPVLGGYIVRGKTDLNGDEFIEQLDKVMEKSKLNDQMSVLYVNDFTILGEEINFDPGQQSSTPAMLPDEAPPVLYVAAADICRESMPVRLSIVSAIGLATTWYLSVYPFLLNPTIAARVDEQLAIADANMVADLSWLSDLSVPLFATFMSIQLSHELGHLIVAGANGIKTSPPTFVPSLFTGITSTVTTFRTPPKNTATMFDYAVAGPIAGIITSILAIAAGCQLTATMADPSLLPALPLEILRQSTLGGGVIEFVLGVGSLSLPKAAIGTAAVAGMTVPLHPVAIAGFISLIVNALAVLPIGTTDGGRMAVALFGRVFKISVATLALIGILFLGSFAGSDLFLFYFLFCVTFQRGNEIPARNEVDKLDLPRCFAAAALYAVAALVLIPFQ